MVALQKGHKRRVQTGTPEEREGASTLGKLDLKCCVSILHELQSQHRMAAFDVGVLYRGARAAEVDILGGGQVS